jgi:DNA-binding MltR family transcriptional regulator
MAREIVEVLEIDRIAAAAFVKDLYDQRFASARTRTEFEIGVRDEANSLSEYALKSDSRTCCILSVSFLEDVLKNNFIDKWKINGQKPTDSYFGGNGPLSSFSQRILIASGLSWIPKDLLKDFDYLRKIRNEFAHNHRIHSLTEEPNRSFANNLREVERIWDTERADVYHAAYAQADQESRLRMRVFGCVMFVTGQVIARSKMIQHELPPGYREDGFFGLTNIEQDLIDVTARHCFRSLKIARSGLG